jgi:hypothetical protein
MTIGSYAKGSKDVLGTKRLDYALIRRLLVYCDIVIQNRSFNMMTAEKCASGLTRP